MMKLNKIALGLAALAVVPAAQAGVTVTPIAGYHYTGAADDAQRDEFKTGKYLNNASRAKRGLAPKTSGNSGVAQTSDLYTGVALGLELTPSTQFQIEYGVSNAGARTSKASWDDSEANRFDAEQQTISGNFLIGLEQVTGYDANTKFKPYALVGAGQSKIEIENQKSYVADAGEKTQTGKTNVPAGTVVAESKDTIGNLGLGAMYRVNDALSLRGEARAIHNFDNDWWEGMALAGLEVVLGGHLGQVEAPEPVLPVEEEKVVIVEDKKPVVVKERNVDSDRDGVIDKRDACPGTPMNRVVDARGCPMKAIVDDALKMELRVFFDNDKSVIKDQYKPEIAKVAEKMRDYPNATARIEGHASKTGPSARYNQRLSEARAVAVKSALANEFGVNPARLSTQGFGYSRPIAPNDTAEGRAMNRRVYAIIKGNKQVTVEKTKDMVK